jgi:hypothetical protein
MRTERKLKPHSAAIANFSAPCLVMMVLGFSHAGQDHVSAESKISREEKAKMEKRER